MNAYDSKQLAEVVVLMRAIEGVLNDTEDLQIYAIPVAFDSKKVGEIEILDKSVFFYPTEQQQDGN